MNAFMQMIFGLFMNRINLYGHRQKQQNPIHRTQLWVIANSYTFYHPSYIYYILMYILNTGWNLICMLWNFSPLIILLGNDMCVRSRITCDFVINVMMSITICIDNRRSQFNVDHRSHELYTHIYVIYM